MSGQNLILPSSLAAEFARTYRSLELWFPPTPEADRTRRSLLVSGYALGRAVVVAAGDEGYLLGLVPRLRDLLASPLLAGGIGLAVRMWIAAARQLLGGAVR